MTGEEIRLHKGSVTLRNIILQKTHWIKHREEMGWTGVKCQDRELKKKKKKHTTTATICCILFKAWQPQA